MESSAVIVSSHRVLESDRGHLFEIRLCAKCGVSKTADEFYRAAEKLSSRCKMCISEKAASYYERNKEQIKERVSIYRKENPEKTKELVNRWHKENPDRASKNNRLWYARNAEAVKERSAVWQRENPEKVRSRELKKKYGLSVEKFNAMLSDQGGACKICKKQAQKNKNLSVDHCHTSNRIRGIICQPCNMALGMVKDNVGVLRSMIAYVEANQDVQGGI